MARAMWRGAIQFGLVTIPVKLYLATETRGISFHLLHESCLSRIQMKTYCPVHDTVIPRSETVRGYELAPGEYVVVTEDDLAAVPLPTVRAIEIEQFADLRHADGSPTFAKQAYYLEPEPIGRKAFLLLKSVLADAGLSGICKVVIKEREQLAALDPYASTLLLTTLYWPDEVRAVGDLDLPAEVPEFKPAERAMAEQLVATMTAEFDPSAHHDAYREALLGLIESKAAGRERPGPRPVEETAGLTDLMRVLEASLTAAGAARLA